MKRKVTCDIWGSHSGVAEDSGLLDFDAVSLGDVSEVS